MSVNMIWEVNSVKYNLNYEKITKQKLNSLGKTMTLRTALELAWNSVRFKVDDEWRICYLCTDGTFALDGLSDDYLDEYIDLENEWDYDSDGYPIVYAKLTEGNMKELNYIECNCWNKKICPNFTGIGQYGSRIDFVLDNESKEKLVKILNQQEPRYTASTEGMIVSIYESGRISVLSNQYDYRREEYKEVEVCYAMQLATNTALSFIKSLDYMIKNSPVRRKDTLLCSLNDISTFLKNL